MFIIVNGVNLFLGQDLAPMEGGRNLLAEHLKALEERCITLVDLVGHVRDHMTNV